MKVEVTENKSVDSLDSLNKLVRVFLNRDYKYGYFIREHELFQMLTPEQQISYLQGTSATLEVSGEIAQQIVKRGHSPFKNQSFGM